MISKIFALLDAEHEAELRVRDGLGRVEIECEDWSGQDRLTVRLSVEPHEAVIFAREIHLCARRARRRAKAAPAGGEERET